jgi:hypothetical protein
MNNLSWRRAKTSLRDVRKRASAKGSQCHDAGDAGCSATARLCTLAAFLMQALGLPAGALAADAQTLQAARAEAVSIARPDLRCTPPPSSRGSRRPAPAASTMTVGSVRITVACADGDSATAVQASGTPSGAAAPGSGASGSKSGGVIPPSPPASTPSADGSTASAFVVDIRSSATAVATDDWFVRAAALFGQLVTLLLAAACGVLAWASFVILREALGMASLVAAVDSPKPVVAGKVDSNATASPLVSAPPSLTSKSAPTPQPFTFQRHWGGFGGASTGWVLSERLIRVIVGLTLGGLAAGLGMQLVPHELAVSRAENASPGNTASAPKARD